ncbi:ubiquitin-like-conjugating enzyme ATG10 [Syngnathus scovelli]|uniref:ubiquitin-like-conjugating enzyme ATG10 n=1 Tax=Syngnathus scovelli TaxID=161590 RepID=UPI00210FD5F2|nr:ubiquitin-like-conjugating enzyme ATG10 isoform X2 [Syngnathus scovelli]
MSCLQGAENFHQCCQVLLKLSDQLRDGWSWEPIQGSEEGYMRKTALKSVFINSQATRNHDGSSSDLESRTSCDTIGDQLEEGATADQADVYVSTDDFGHEYDEDGSRSLLQYEYHIVYSCSYMAPVLYFRASTLEGRSLSLEEVWSFVHPNFRSRLQHSPLTTITQQEHPLLGQPFFMIHPCKTEEFMRPVLQLETEQHRQANYILTWLSVVGPLVGLDVSLKYSTLQSPPTQAEASLQPVSPS